MLFIDNKINTEELDNFLCNKELIKAISSETIGEEVLSIEEIHDILRLPELDYEVNGYMLTTKKGNILMDINVLNNMSDAEEKFVKLTALYSYDYEVLHDYIGENMVMQINLVASIGRVEELENEIDEYFVMDEDGKKYVENFEVMIVKMQSMLNFWHNHNENKIKKYKNIIMLALDEQDANILKNQMQ